MGRTNSCVKGGNASLGFDVKFKLDNADYYLASCQQGERVSAPPIPVNETTNLIWKLNNNEVMFPYTPNGNVELIGERSLIPTRYTPLNYIKSTGSQYIDTGVEPRSYNGVGIKIDSMSIDATNPSSSFENNGIFGTQTTIENGAAATIINFRYSKLTMITDKHSSDFSTVPAFVETFSLEAGWSTDLAKSYAKVNNNVVATYSGAFSVSTNPCYLFAFWFSNNNSRSLLTIGSNVIITGAIATDQTLEGATVLRNLYPVYDTVNQRPCFYDIITNQAFYNAGTGEFLYG